MTEEQSNRVDVLIGLMKALWGIDQLKYGHESELYLEVYDQLQKLQSLIHSGLCDKRTFVAYEARMVSLMMSIIRTYELDVLLENVRIGSE